MGNISEERLREIRAENPDHLPGFSGWLVCALLRLWLVFDRR